MKAFHRHDLTSPTVQDVLPATRKIALARDGLQTAISTWLPVAMGLIVIAIESTEKLGPDFTGSILRPIFDVIIGPMTDARFEVLHHLVRKSGHFVGYGTLGMTWLRAWMRTFTPFLHRALTIWWVGSASLAILCTFLTASADEFHQTFLPGRTGQFSDVVLDTCGALLFSGIVMLLWRHHRHSNANAKIMA